MDDHWSYTQTNVLQRWLIYTYNQIDKTVIAMTSIREPRKQRHIPLFLRQFVSVRWR
ncbi:hypothetical protein CJP72_12755 [Citrobacter sp. NCU1]|nr:hypothetical protein [Citrobacter sp. NCU1]